MNMTQRAGSITALLLVAGTSSLHAQRGPPDPERAAARQVLLELASNIQDGKWAQADSAFATRGLHVLADTMAFHSWADYREKSLKPDLAKFSGLKVVHTGVEAQVRGNVAWVAFKQEIGGSSGTPRIGRGSAVLEKLDGRWTIVHYHISR
jgi:hypothetical protein